MEDTNALESPNVPAEAQVMGPGKDIVLLADDTYWYVEDSVTNLVTIAKRDESTLVTTSDDTNTTEMPSETETPNGNETEPTN